MKRKPKLDLIRKILFWVIYDTRTHEIVDSAKYKYLLGVPSRDSGRVIIQCTGFYPRSLTQEGRSDG